jgi:hypothetical protein
MSCVVTILLQQMNCPCYLFAFTILVVKRSSISLMKYIGAEYSKYWMFRVAEFLDPRTFRTLSTKDKREEFMDLINLCIYAHL